VNGTLITGTMADNGAVTSTLNAGGSYTIPAGYHNGSGKVTAKSSEDGTKLYNLGTYTSTSTSSSATFDLSTVTTDYANYTASDFILELTSLTGGGSLNGATYDQYIIPNQPTKSYDASTGVLNVSGAYFRAGGRDYNYGDHHAYCRMTFNVYVKLKV
ncbi:MAG: hypothetical protein ACI31M_02295, partial [Bacilli bacterium]